MSTESIEQLINAESEKIASKMTGNAKPTKKQIVVLQRGWIVIGDVAKEDEQISIKNCSVIRVWGTSKGLGEIAKNGPTGNTKLDPCPDCFVHPMTVVMYMNVDESKW